MNKLLSLRRMPLYWRFFRRSPFWLQLAIMTVGFRYLRRAVLKRLP